MAARKTVGYIAPAVVYQTTIDAYILDQQVKQIMYRKFCENRIAGFITAFKNNFTENHKQNIFFFVKMR